MYQQRLWSLLAHKCILREAPSSTGRTGGYFHRGVSGGERKRVSVGHELLINPSVLLLVRCLPVLAPPAGTRDRPGWAVFPMTYTSPAVDRTSHRSLLSLNDLQDLHRRWLRGMAIAHA